MQLKKVVFMFQKLVTDLRTKGSFVEQASDVTSQRLTHYYILFGDDLSKLNKLIRGYDEDGIPLNNSYIDVQIDQPHYYPISIGQVGLALFHQYLKDENPAKKAHFLRIADWFVENKSIDPRLGIYWETKVPKPEYDVHTPWKSAFSQSRGISILTRAWQETGEDKYLDVATGALESFKFDIEDGGVAIRRGIECAFYEEYVAAYPTRVLDGHFFSLFGLYDYVRAVPESSLAKSLFQDGINELIRALPLYDLGYWVLFNRCEIPGYPKNDPCTINYLQLVIVQLEIIYKITEREEVLAYVVKFRGYIKWKNILKMYRLKFTALTNLNRI